MGVQITFNTETLQDAEGAGLLTLIAAIMREDSVTTWATRWLDNGVDPVEAVEAEAKQAETYLYSLREPLAITAEDATAAVAVPATEVILGPAVFVPPRNVYMTAAEAFGGVPLPTAPPVLATPGLAPAVAGVELDSTGLPWDARIHAATRARNVDGSWRTKRGADKDEVASVSAHLRALVGGAPAPVEETPVLLVTDANGELVRAPEPVVPPPPPPAPAPAAAMTTAQLFAGFMRKITPLQSAGRLTAVAVNEACAEVGIAAVRDLMVRADLIPLMEAAIDRRTTA